MNEGVARLSVTEMLAEVGDERVYPDALDGLGISMQSIEFAAPLSVAEVQRVFPASMRDGSDVEAVG